MLPCFTSAAEITVLITTNDQYVQQGKPDQKNVEVTAGQSVAWKNEDGAPHTASSDLRVALGGSPVKFIFNTGQIGAGQTSADQPFTTEMYDKAKAALGIPDPQAGAPMPRVHLGYYCINHPETMGGKIVLYRSAADRDRLLEMEKDHKTRPIKEDGDEK